MLLLSVIVATGLFRHFYRCLSDEFYRIVNRQAVVDMNVADACTPQ